MSVDPKIVLRQACEAAGSQKAFAKKHDLSEQYVSDVLSGRREPGRLMCHALGLERHVSYLPIQWVWMVNLDGSGRTTQVTPEGVAEMERLGYAVLTDEPRVSD